MVETHPTLQVLPVETLKRIASFLPCESALCLMKTSHQMHSICNDELVFKGIIKNANGKPSRRHHPQLGYIVPPWILPSALTSKPNAEAASAWARFALADSRARDLVEKLETRDGVASVPETMAELSLWLPQVVAFHHPALEILNMQHLFLALNRSQLQGRYTMHEELLTFCLSGAVLQQGTMNGVEGTYYGGLSIFELKHYHMDDEIRVPRAPFVPIVFAWAIQIYCGTGKNSLTAILPPLPQIIPFPALMDLPLPFSPIPAFKDTFLPNMTSKSFLEDEEWVGYYSLNTELQPNLIEPMQGIRFSANAGDHGKIVLRSPGFDGVGTFELKGTLNADGSALLVKTHATGISWEWNAEMTPLGLVGVWGSLGSRRELGHIWLWKREWCRAPV